VCECIYLSVVQQRRLIIKIIKGVGIGEGGWEGICLCLTKETKLLDVISTTCCCIIELKYKLEHFQVSSQTGIFREFSPGGNYIQLETITWDVEGSSEAAMGAGGAAPRYVC
jgi:hypothetical protein